MEFRSTTDKPQDINTACLVIPVTDGSLNETATTIDDTLNGRISSAIASGDISTKAGSTFLISPGTENAERVLLAGCGDNTRLSVADFITVNRAVAKRLTKLKVDSAVNCITSMTVEGRDSDWACQHAALAMDWGNYQYTATKEVKKPSMLNTVTFFSDADESVLVSASATAEGVRRARDLGNLPPNICTPRYLTEVATEIAALNENSSVEILDRDAMQELGMGALLGVAQGSANEPYLIVLKHLPNADEKPIGLVGKGITFDTGGISLKPGKGMHEMKYDMGGAAAMIGTFETCVRENVQRNVIAVIPAVENMPDGLSYRPGDVLTSMSGKTIEVLNTDAEGRLILCDALTYIQQFEPEWLIDAATLTGACVIALGKHATAVMTDDDELADALLDAGVHTHDRAWRLPLWDDYQKQIDTPYADVANVGGADGGAITAGCFLKRFTKGQRWAHLDIAGTAWDGGTKNGATGRPVTMLSEFIRRNANTD